MLERSMMVLVILLFGLCTGLPQAVADDVCLELEEEIVGKIFVAKVPLYDTEVGFEGISKLERDKEEIPKGAEFTVLEVDCERKEIEMTLRQNVVGRKAGKVEIHLFFHQKERTKPDAREVLDTIIGHVFEKAEESEE
jgi:hypothetical protein